MLNEIYFNLNLVPDFPNVTYIPQYNTKGDLTKLTLNIIEVSMFNIINQCLIILLLSLYV